MRAAAMVFYLPMNVRSRSRSTGECSELFPFSQLRHHGLIHRFPARQRRRRLID
ncbi:hypothetical protein KCP76_26330 (plasmid) [Salmonella enterica subsp. enterica serovar Weltevreden]|nr:hypothetical protein KCP76_26330 [Salmonella enterica subsp. enterica serovar Weltevreden]QUI99492.1 hypothetical protein KCP74_25750 [Salmonella enterica subsp. enterica]QUJ01260.1 hypothetical protein KCP73_27075 [Salmonella enterica subsp. enterica]